ncbi:NADP-dependent malic enzyme [Mangrovivirga sp. M17]|uniref:NADP-dependent malic enzyme n=1 Tax=Mangrovivirga halotolerans TaxID=2993936 RepID=A0ABT3RNP1_9BACT|nr:NADP-dependent malic enzyme [Mangrovivirga halotolerans]MCX2742882.1 NADP-dependent malic enzyme [Mangrovivirga halotolerans]
MAIKIRKQDALNYHKQEPAGKIEVVPTKALGSQLDLALAYSPGVAEPCKEINKDPEKAYSYTAKGNLVAVISNGTAVLGLGDIGPEASKPVMEGKGVLFKKFAGIDVFDIEVNENDPQKFIDIVKSLEPTFGGINLEDIKAPDCFIIEKELKEKLNIPVMHDDQHGTAIISAAALINALELSEKKIEDLKIVVNGAGAASVSCTKLYLSLGAKRENIVMLDSKGVIRKDRGNLDETKQEFATDRDITTMDDAIDGADMFLGLSVGNVLSKEQVKKMADNPIIFALANPDPEIPYDDAMEARPDAIMATGRSDHPNQVNNVLGFPYIFRGALDVRSKEINEEMKLAAVYALAELAKEPVPEMVTKAYNEPMLSFGKEYLIPKPLDPRLITTISPAVAKAAIDSGVARINISNWEEYNINLQQRLGIDTRLMARIIQRARKNPKRVVFAEADHIKILKAAQTLVDEGIAQPILLGNEKLIKELVEENGLELHDCPIIDPYLEKDKRKKYGEKLYLKRQRKGITKGEAVKLMRDRNYFGAMMVETGEADALISGLTKDYRSTIKPSLQVIGTAEDVEKVAGIYIIKNNKGTFYFGDTTVNVDPSAEELSDLVGLVANGVKFFDSEPRIAMLSYSNFGSASGKTPEKVQKAVKMAKNKFPDLVIDGDIQANVALDTEIQQNSYPFSQLAEKGANTLIFPDLTSGNIAYKLLMEMGGAEGIGPILLGMNKPVHILQLGSSIREIINMVAIAVVDAQSYDEKKRKK